MDQQPNGPMNFEWFYKKSDQPFAVANKLHQKQKWEEAVGSYDSYLDFCFAPDDDRNMAKLNRAACKMAQGQATKDWKRFDALLNIPKSQRFAMDLLTDIWGPEASVLVRTDMVGIGDIFHFLSAAYELKKRTQLNVILSVPQFLIATLASAAKGYSFELIGAKDAQPNTDYVTHLIALLGHLELTPAKMNPKKVMFTAPERAMLAVYEQIEPVLAQGNNLAAVFLGEARQATLIGGKQLPRDVTRHGRNLTSEPFKQLLRNYPKLVLIDCGTAASRVVVDEDQAKQYMVLAKEEQPFDTIIALARVMSMNEPIVGFGADNGPTNVFARSLDNAAQERMALVIPNAQEHDMRMNGKGDKYKQMISNCWVYKCATPLEQGMVIDRAYQDMLAIKH
jgi:hypothetical protein